MDKRAGDRTFADYAKAGRANFGEAAEAFIMWLPVNDRSRSSYLSAYRTHVKPVYEDHIARVANDREGVPRTHQVQPAARQANANPQLTTLNARKPADHQL